MGILDSDQFDELAQYIQDILRDYAGDPVWDVGVGNHRSGRIIEIQIISPTNKHHSYEIFPRHIDMRTTLNEIQSWVREVLAKEGYGCDKIDARRKLISQIDERGYWFIDSGWIPPITE